LDEIKSDIIILANLPLKGAGVRRIAFLVTNIVSREGEAGTGRLRLENDRPTDKCCVCNSILEYVGRRDWIQPQMHQRPRLIPRDKNSLAKLICSRIIEAIDWRLSKGSHSRKDGSSKERVYESHYSTMLHFNLGALTREEMDYEIPNAPPFSRDKLAHLLKHTLAVGSYSPVCVT
jgi:hypothetical protein